MYGKSIQGGFAKGCAAKWELYQGPDIQDTVYRRALIKLPEENKIINLYKM